MLEGKGGGWKMYLTPAIQPFINQTLVEAGGTLAVILAIASKPFILSQHSTIASSDTGSATRIRIACTVAHLCWCTWKMFVLRSIWHKNSIFTPMLMYCLWGMFVLRSIWRKEQSPSSPPDRPRSQATAEHMRTGNSLIVTSYPSYQHASD